MELAIKDDILSRRRNAENDNLYSGTSLYGKTVECPPPKGLSSRALLFMYPNEEVLALG